MKKNIINILILIALIVVIVLKLSENKKTAESRVYHYDKSQPILVHAMDIKTQPLVINKDLTGNFMADKSGKINADVQGKVISIPVKEGDYVKKGQLLIRLDPTLLQLKKKALDSKVSGLQEDVKRYKILAAADAIQAVKLEKTELGLKAALAERKSVIEQIQKTNIRAPFSGYITHKFTELGSFAAPGMPLMELTKIGKLQFTINVSENDLDLFDYHQKYPISVDALPGTEVTGTLSMIASKANPSNDYPVKFDVLNTKDKKIKSGMFGVVKLRKDYGSEVILIPATAIVGSEQDAKVYVIENGKAKLRKVVITKHVGNNVVVKEGLKPGEKIVTAGFINLFDGANVTTK